MPSERIPVNWLRAFEVASRHLSFSAAAQELNVTPAAVSQQVRLLEHRLGSALFQRHARGLRLTAAGESLVPACRESFERLDSTVTELFGRHRRDRLVVREALGFARQWLLDAVGTFSAAHPDVPIRVLASVWSTDAPDERIDVDIRLCRTVVRGMVAHRLTSDQMFPVCGPMLLKGRSRLRDPADLARQRLLVPIGFAQGWRQWLQEAGVARPLRPSDLEFDSMRLALEAAALGHGVALARSSYVADLLEEDRLRVPFALRIPARDELCLLHAQGIDADSPTALLRDWLLARAPANRSPSRGSRRARIISEP